MKKLVKIIISMLLMNIILVSSVQAATTKYTVPSDSKNEYMVSIRLKPGDSVVIYSADENPAKVTIANQYNECSKNESTTDYEGYMFKKPVKKKVLQEANIRKGPGMKFEVVNHLDSGDIVTATGLFEGVDCDWDWYLLDDGTYTSAHLFEDA